jgi:hypothetical protein
MVVTGELDSRETVNVSRVTMVTGEPMNVSKRSHIDGCDYRVRLEGAR